MSNKADEKRLVFSHVEFYLDGDGDLEIELTVKDGESYQGRFLDQDQIRQLSEFLRRVAP